MSARSRDARLLGRVLTTHARVPVAVTYHGNACGHDGGWHVEWCDGPTGTTMRALAATAGTAHSIRCPIRAYDRAESDLARAAALLTWIAANPGREITTLVACDAYDAAEHPQAADETTLRRARALLSLTQHAMLGLAAMAALRSRARSGDVPQWLDGIAAAAADPAVAHLAPARARLRGRLGA